MIDALRSSAASYILYVFFNLVGSYIKYRNVTIPIYLRNNVVQKQK